MVTLPLGEPAASNRLPHRLPVPGDAAHVRDAAAGRRRRRAPRRRNSGLPVLHQVEVETGLAPEDLP